MKLSQTRADKNKKPGRYGDGRGLYLQITRTGSRSWLIASMLAGNDTDARATLAQTMLKLARELDPELVNVRWQQ